MQVDMKIRRHPGKAALLAYAENLVDNRAAIDRALASHLSQCAACQAEVRAMQESISFVASAPELEPDSELTAQILMAGKQARSEMKRGSAPLRAAWKVAQAAACAAGMVVVAGLSFAAFVGAPEQENAAPVFQSSVPVMAEGGQSPEALRQAAVDVAEEVQTLSAAIKSKNGGEGQTPQEQEQMRVVLSRDADIAAAITALERNPKNVRATHVLHTYLKDLRSIYVEGGSL